MLRRRHFPQTQAPGKTKRRQKKDETHWPRRHSAGGFPGRPEGRRRQLGRLRPALSTAGGPSPATLRGGTNPRVRNRKMSKSQKWEYARFPLIPRMLMSNELPNWLLLRTLGGKKPA